MWPEDRNEVPGGGSEPWPIGKYFSTLASCLRRLGGSQVLGLSDPALRVGAFCCFSPCVPM